MFRRRHLWSVAIALLLGIVTYAIVSNIPKQSNQQEVIEELDDGVEKTPVSIQPNEIITVLINSLVRGDEEVYHSFFGESDLFTPNSLVDKIQSASVTLIYDEEYDITEDLVADPNLTYSVLTHICTYNYYEMELASGEIYASLEETDMTDTEKKVVVGDVISSRLLDGEFDLHITLPIDVIYTDGVGTVDITEKLKVALTGGYYNPTNAEIINGECILDYFEE